MTSIGSADAARRIWRHAAGGGDAAIYIRRGDGGGNNGSKRQHQSGGVAWRIKWAIAGQKRNEKKRRADEASGGESAGKSRGIGSEAAALAEKQRLMRWPAASAPPQVWRQPKTSADCNLLPAIIAHAV